MMPSKSCRQAPCFLNRGRAAFPAKKMACLSTFVCLFNFQDHLVLAIGLSYPTESPSPSLTGRSILFYVHILGLLILSEKF